MSQDGVLFEERQTNTGQRIGIATLNRPDSLNAIGLDMIGSLYHQLLQWRDDPEVVCIWLSGQGDRAFCAGGDVRALAQQLRSDPQKGLVLAEAFFTREYRLDYLIHCYPKPVLAWGDGIVMGGGLGLMVGASHRVVTERTRMAMPEISIGLYPDVGGSWFMSRMPGRTGLFAGLTGATLNGSDALYAGLADRLLASHQRDALQEELLQLAWSYDSGQNRRELNRLLRYFEQDKGVDELPDSLLQRFTPEINRALDVDHVADMLAQLQILASRDPWLEKAAITLAEGCPVTAGIVQRQLDVAPGRSLAQLLRMELGVSLRCCMGPDFIEGVRARLLDKDQQPRWQHSSLEAITEQLIDHYFISPWPRHPLINLEQKFFKQ